jgi:hypothetical protein
LINDPALGAGTTVTVKAAVPGDTTDASAQKTVWSKVVGNTPTPLHNLSEAFYDSSDAARTTNYWFPMHSGEIEVSVTGAGGASAKGLTVVLVVEF